MSVISKPFKGLPDHTEFNQSSYHRLQASILFALSFWHQLPLPWCSLAPNTVVSSLFFELAERALISGLRTCHFLFFPFRSYKAYSFISLNAAVLLWQLSLSHSLFHLFSYYRCLALNTPYFFLFIFSLEGKLCGCKDLARFFHCCFLEA